VNFLILVYDQQKDFLYVLTNYFMNKAQLFLTSILLASGAPYSYAQIIKFTNGDSLDVEVIEATETTFTYSHAILGEQTVYKSDIDNFSDLNLDGIDQVTDVVMDQVTDVAMDQVTDVATSENVNDGFMGTGYFQDWDSSISLGMNGAAGTTNHISVRTEFTANYRDEYHRWDFQSSYLYHAVGEDGENFDGNKLWESKANSKLVKEWFFIDSMWFVHVSTTYDYDEFKSWEHRFQIEGGGGYHLIKGGTWDISARTGLTGVFEFERKGYDANYDLVAIEDAQNLKAVLGVDVEWNITKKQRIIVSNYTYFSLDGDDIRNMAEVAWIDDLDFFEGLALKVDIKDVYNTNELTQNEFKYNVSVLWYF
jgi:hypothetical protein